MGIAPGKVKLLFRVAVILGACSAIASAISVWAKKGEGMMLMVALIMLITSVGLFAAYFALNHEWHGQWSMKVIQWLGEWYLQVIGPSLLMFVLFGTTAAIATAIAGVVVCWLLSRKSNAASLNARVTSNVGRLEDNSMRNSPRQRRQLDIAYICFLIPGACVFLGIIGGLIVSGLDIEPAYFGFFVVMPLVLMSAVAIAYAIVLTITLGRRDPALILLSIASIVVFVGGLTEFGGDFFAFTVAPVLYVLLVVVLEFNWFFVRRKTYNEADTVA